jgi:xyloglucan-specific exo-beta-1,4-glucanase
VLWKPWVEGVEQTAVITLSSPAKGAHLISGFGDIGGFVHFDMNKSVPMSANPLFINTNNIDYAERAPNVVVRSGTHEPHATVKTATLGYSTDFGKTWKPLYAPLPAGYTEIPPEKMPYNHSDPYTDSAIVTSADGKTFVVMTPEPVLTRDRGKTWLKIVGLPAGGRPVPDRLDPKRFYAVDFDTGAIYISTDGARSFKPQQTTGLPADIKGDRPHWREIAWPLLATPNMKSDLWFLSQGRLFHSLDAGKTFAEIKTGLTISAMDFGKAAPGKKNMTLFALAEKGPLGAIWRSTDDGASWIRVNDARSEYGRTFRCLAADKRIFGRVYVGTDGRGIVFGEPSR